MKRLSIMLFAAVAVVGCADKNKSGIVISDQNAENIAYDMSYELATKAIEAQNYEEFKRARVELEGYEEAFRDQIGGEAYLLYLEECNAILGEL
ncbi:MAG: hypothetical protein IKY20_07655 [Alistipes sp.]|nr:hypothetical protein [Alistipes sp.]